MVKSLRGHRARLEAEGKDPPGAEIIPPTFLLVPGIGAAYVAALLRPAEDHSLVVPLRRSLGIDMRTSSICIADDVCLILMGTPSPSRRPRAS